MPNKSLTALIDSKNNIVNRIKSRPEHVAPTEKSDVYVRTVWSLVGWRDFAAKGENNKKELLELSNRISVIWEEMLYKVEVLNLYRAASIEQRKMAASDKIPETYKQINKNNILEIERALKEKGFTDEQLKAALNDVNFEKKFLPGYTEKVSGEITGFAQKHGLQLNEKRPLRSIVESMMYHTGASQKGLVRKVEELDTLQGYKKLPSLGFYGGDHKYFKVTIEPTADEKKSDYTEDHYKFFVLKDGQFVDRPAPSGFFSKIGFYFRKYIWDVDDFDREKKLVAKEAERERDEIAKVPENIDEQLVADLTPMGDAKEMSVIEEPTEQAVKNETADLTQETVSEQETVSVQDKEKEIDEFKADLKQRMSKTNVSENEKTEKISEPIVGEKNKDNERVVEG